MMVDAGCVLVFREGKMISFAKNNKNSQKNGKIWINKVSVWY